jgi:hypothetical protein
MYNGKGVLMKVPVASFSMTGDLYCDMTFESWNSGARVNIHC